MHLLWGLLTVGIGLFMVICGTLQSEFVLYRLMAARARLLWGNGVHRFFQVSGTLVVAMGALMAFGIV